MTPLRRRISEATAGNPMLLGTFLAIPSPAVVEIVCASGPDFVCIDQEHGSIGSETLEHMLRAAELARVPALVRVPSHAPEAIAMALDCGAAGVLVPRVSSAAQAKAAVDAARYAPDGSRGAGPGRATGYGRAIVARIAAMREETVVAIQIETCDALDHLEEILAVPNIDLVFVGPGDLGVSLVANKRVISLADAVETILDAAAKAGHPTGVFAMTREVARTYQDKVAMAVCGSDATVLISGFDSTFEE